MSHSSASRPISVSIVGAAGLIGRRHVQHVLDDAGFTLTSIVDPTPAGVELAKELGVSYFADIAALLGPSPSSEAAASSLPQAAIIATPSALHVPQAILFVERGIHVLIEKPLCNSSEEAVKLLQPHGERALARSWSASTVASTLTSSSCASSSTVTISRHPTQMPRPSEGWSHSTAFGARASPCPISKRHRGACQDNKEGEWS